MRQSRRTSAGLIRRERHVRHARLQVVLRVELLARAGARSRHQRHHPCIDIMCITNALSVSA